MNYRDEIIRAMDMLGRIENSVFLGQSVKYPGNAIYKTLLNVPDEKKIELPVAEDMQMGMSIGLSLQGFLPISIYPRMDFLIIAMNQLVNHLDKIEELSHGIFKPKVIIRTMIGSKTPLDAGLQHTGDYTGMLRAGLNNVVIADLYCAEMVHFSYYQAFERSVSTILIERGELYD